VNIHCLRMTATHSRKRQEQARTCQDTRNSVLDQILERIRGLQNRVSRLEVTIMPIHHNAKTNTNY